MLREGIRFVGMACIGLSSRQELCADHRLPLQVANYPYSTPTSSKKTFLRVFTGTKSGTSEEGLGWVYSAPRIL